MSQSTSSNTQDPSTGRPRPTEDPLVLKLMAKSFVKPAIALAEATENENVLVLEFVQSPLVRAAFNEFLDDYFDVLQENCKTSFPEGSFVISSDLFARIEEAYAKLEAGELNQEAIRSDEKTSWGEARHVAQFLWRCNSFLSAQYHNDEDKWFTMADDRFLSIPVIFGTLGVCLRLWDQGKWTRHVDTSEKSAPADSLVAISDDDADVIALERMLDDCSAVMHLHQDDEQAWFKRFLGPIRETMSSKFDEWLAELRENVFSQGPIVMTMHMHRNMQG